MDLLIYVYTWKHIKNPSNLWHCSLNCTWKSLWWDTPLPPLLESASEFNQKKKKKDRQDCKSAVEDLEVLVDGWMEVDFTFALQRQTVSGLHQQNCSQWVTGPSVCHSAWQNTPNTVQQLRSSQLKRDTEKCENVLPIASNVMRVLKVSTYEEGIWFF